MIPRPLCDRCLDLPYPLPTCRACEELTNEYRQLGLLEEEPSA